MYKRQNRDNRKLIEEDTKDSKPIGKDFFSYHELKKLLAVPRMENLFKDMM